MQILFSSRSFLVNLGAHKSGMGSTGGNYFAESNTKFELPVHVRNGTAVAHIGVASWTSSIGSQVNACIYMRRACNALQR